MYLRALATLLVASTVFAQTSGPLRRFQKNFQAGRAYPYLFEFAPTDGVGMGTACACTAVRGTRNETITLTRSSSGTCMKGGLFTGIANGDMVTCSSNDTPRVMPGGDGTGYLGLLVEAARENRCLRSEETDNVAWSSTTNGGAASITVTADQAVAPDGTTTADRWQVPACATASSQFSLRYQSLGTSAAYSGSVFLKGNGESGTLHLWVVNAAANNACVSCSYNASTWTRCVHENVTATTNGRIYIGSDPLDCGGGDQPAKDVFVWGVQYEAGAYVTSYVKTVGSAVTRAEELASFARPSGFSNSEGCIGASMFTYKSGASIGLLSMQSHYVGGLACTSTTNCRVDDGTNFAATAISSYVGRLARVVGGWKSSNNSLLVNSDGVTNTGTYDGTMGASGVVIGSYDTSGNFRVDGVVKKVIADTSQSGCAP